MDHNNENDLKMMITSKMKINSKKKTTSNMKMTSNIKTTLNLNKTRVESVQLGKTLDSNL